MSEPLGVKELRRARLRILDPRALPQMTGPRLVVHPLCECWLVLGGPLTGVLGGREPTEGRVGPVGVVLDPPCLDEDLSLGKGTEVLHVEQLVSDWA